jgi:hypothetical protein
MKSAYTNSRALPFPTSLHEVFSSSLGKRLLTLGAALGLVACATPSANAANVLFNPTLDSIDFFSQNGKTPVGWTVDAVKAISGVYADGGSSESWCNVLDPDGYGFFFKPFAGSQPDGDLLTVDLYQDNPATPGTKFTLSGYAAAEGNYSGFFNTNSPAPETLFIIYFLDNTGTVISGSSNVFDLISAGLPNTGPGSMASFLYTTPQVTAPPNTVTVRAGVSMRNTYGTSGQQSFFVDAFDLEATAPAGSPIITNQPASATPAPGATAHFAVGISNPSGVTYQWQLNNINLSNGGHVSGASSDTLTITGASASDVGHYRVLVSNGAGSVYSSDAALALETLNFYPVITLTGKVGDTYRVDYSTSVAPTTWIPLSTNKLTISPQTIIDTTAAGNNSRFYRSVFLY